MERQEVKYLIDPRTSDDIVHMAGGFVVPDENGPGGQYMIASLYLDDAQWSSARESMEGVKDRCKLRLRCYSFEPDAPVWAEIKRRRGTTVVKSRARIPRSVADAVCRGEDADPSASKDPRAFEAFLLEKYRRNMAPRLWVKYQRLAFHSAFGDSARLTVDRDLEVQESESNHGYTADPKRWQAVPVFPERILELKYDGRFPGWMQDLVRVVDIRKQSVSKYGRGCELYYDDLMAQAGWSRAWTAT